jgi:hypothetical protein
VCSLEKTKHIQYYNSYLEKKKRLYLLLSYYRFHSKFTIALIYFQSRYLIHFEISNNIIREDRFEGGRELSVFIKRGHGLRKVEKHYLIQSLDLVEMSVTRIRASVWCVEFAVKELRAEFIMHIFPLHRLSFLCVLNVVGCLGNASL